MKPPPIRRIAPPIPWLELARRAQYRVDALGTIPGWRMHPRTLRRRLRVAFGTTPQRWLDGLRMKEARRLLRLGERTKEIAGLLGYQTASHFCRHFRRRHRRTPQEWRAKQRA